jgi:ABC-2 type transport system ATP-binding protein
MSTVVSRTEPIITLRDIGVRFSRNRRRRKRSLRDLLLRGRIGADNPGEFWPFRHVSLDIYPGETIGVVGRNGVGKSTLLSVIAGVLLPDEGEVTVRAGVAPLIQITGGFEPELTGRQNIQLVAGLHGMSDAEIAENFDEIVDFSELGDFLDTPFKHYSSGMKVRLAFSVVSRLDEPILLIDEVLAVGDRAFRNKCLERIKQLVAGGTTLFLVSHSRPSLVQFCERGIYLEGGAMRMDGPIEAVLDQYEKDIGVWNEPGIDGEFEVDASAGSSDDDYE